MALLFHSSSRVVSMPRSQPGPFCFGRKQRQRGICWGVSAWDKRFYFGRHKGWLPVGYLRWTADMGEPCWIMCANLAGGVLVERIGIIALETGEKQQKKRVFRGLACSPLETDEQQQKKLVSTSLAGGQISVKDCTSASLEEKAERLKDALNRLEQRGTETNSDTYASLLQQCTDAKALPEGKRLYAYIMRSKYSRNKFLWNLLVSMFGKCGSPDDARCAFDKMPRRDVVSWNAMISAYSQNGRGKEAMELFLGMDLEGLKPNKITFICLLDACAGLAMGRDIHASIVGAGFETDVVVGTAHINMYGKFGSQDDARRMFDKLPRRNVVSWNAMIAAYAQNGRGKKAMELFGQMELEGMKPDKVTFISALDACASVAAIVQGQRIHASITNGGFEMDVAVGNALVNMYGKCGSLDDARSVFDKMPRRNVVSWTAIIATYAQNGLSKAALELFGRMGLEGVKPNKITFTCVLDACASLAALATGQGIHASIINGGFEIDVVLGTALVNMYGKCGSLDDARSVFDKMPLRNVVSWTAMIAAYAQNGCGKEALKLFRWMGLEGVKPDRITLISILSACSHAGLLDDGWGYLVCMSRDHGITPTAEHYTCMIDLIGRAGQLDEAHDLITNMSFQPDAVAWMTFLGACRIHGEVERGAGAARHVLKLDTKNAAPYVLLSNIYAATGRQDDVAKVRQVMEGRGVKKYPGLSCIEVKKSVHQFVVGDTSHPQKEEIYAELQRLSHQMEEAGYMPDTKSVLHDVEDEEKQYLLYHHSEKLAISFGLISTPAGASLHIIKNLRVCSDCHAATKFISEIVGRKIIVRDANRFHHFEHGVCSCADYW